MSEPNATFGLFAELFGSIKLHMKWSDDKTFFWWNTENPNMGNSKPFNFFQKRPEKCAEMIFSMLKEGKEE